VTVDEWDAGLGNTGAKWLGNSNGKLFWAIKDDTVSGGIRHFNAMTSDGNGIYHIDIPAVYNGMECTLYRCNNSWSAGNTTDSDGVTYWDKWTTAFPNSFHSETFSVFSHKYATWEETTNNFFFIDSAEFETLGDTPHAYLWDHNSEYTGGVNAKVVKNANWPGKPMTKLATTTNSKSIRVWENFFASTYDRAVLSDGRGGENDSKGLQTQDLWIGSSQYNNYFDMSTLSWHNSKDYFTYTDCFVIGNFNQDSGHTTKIRMAYNSNFENSGSTWFICKFYNKSDNAQYFFKIYDQAQGTSYGRPSGWQHWASGSISDGYMRNIGASNNEGDLVWIKDLSKGMYKIYYDYNSHKMEWWPSS
jgi:hypothetical protein